MKKRTSTDRPERTGGSTPPAPPRSRRRRRWVGWVLGILAVPVILVVAVLVALSQEGVRLRILDEALTRANEALPGRIEATRLEWPGLLDLDFVDVRWIDDGDTLVALDRFRFAASTAAVLARQIEIDTVAVLGLRANVPAMVTRFPADTTEEDPPSGEPGAVPWFRDGALPGAPSVAVHSLTLDAPWIQLDPEVVLVDVAVSGHIDVRHDSSPRIEIAQVRGREQSGLGGIEHMALSVSFAEEAVNGSGRGHFGSHWPLEFSVSTGLDGGFELLLQETDGAPPPDGFGVRADGTLEWVDRQLHAIHLESVIRVPTAREMARDPVLAPHVADLRRVPVPLVHATADLVLRPEFAASAVVGLSRDDWLDGRAVVTYEGGELLADSVAIRLDDLTLAGRFHMRDERMDTDVTVSARGPGWLERIRSLVPEGADSAVVVPDSLWFDLAAEAVGAMTDLRAHATLEGRVVHEGLRVDTLALAVDVPDLGAGAVEAVLMTQVHGYRLRTELEAELPDAWMPVPPTGEGRSELAVKMAPLVVLDMTARRGEGPFRDPPPVSMADAATVAFDPVALRVRADDLQINGDLGLVAIDADVGMGEGGDVQVVATWPYPPSVVAPPVPVEMADQYPVVAEWLIGDAPQIAVQATVTRPDEDRLHVRGQGEITLPGPSAFSSRLPEGVVVSDLGTLRGRFTAEGEIDSTGQRFQANLDLSETAWIDTTFVIAAFAAGPGGVEVQVDSLGVRLLGMSMEGAVTSEPDGLSGGVVALLETTELIRRFAPQAPPDLRMAARVGIDLGGTPDHPDADVTVDAAADMFDIRVPRLHAEASLREGSLRSSIVRAESLFVHGLRLREVSADYTAHDRPRGEPADERGVIDGAVALRVAGPDFELTQSGDIQVGEAIQAQVDSLYLRVMDRDLRATSPFTVRVDGDSLTTDGNVLLAGSLGRVALDRPRSSPEARLRGEMDLTLPPPPEWLELPPGLWPERVTVEMAQVAADSLVAQGSVQGLHLGNRDNLALDLQLARGAQAVVVDAVVADASPMIDLHLRLPATAIDPIEEESAPGSDEATPAGEAAVAPGDSVSLAVTLTEVPLPGPAAAGAFLGYLDRGGQTREPRLNGNLSVSGTTTEPTVETNATLTFPGFPVLSGHVGKLEGRITPETGVQATLDWTRGGAPMTTGHASVPGRLTLVPAVFTAADTGNIDVVLRAPAVVLQEFNALLPAEIQVNGQADFSLVVQGPIRDPGLEGHLRTRNISMRLPDRSRASLNGAVELSGSGAQPRLDGNLEVSTALIRLPDPPPDLLPTTGGAMLWDEIELEGGFTAEELEVIRTVRRDTLLVPPSPMELLPPETQVNMKVRIPGGGFRIIGRGLDVDLAGDLDVKLEKGKPVLIGELRPVRGSLNAIGRVFQVERGVVYFFGDDQFNPTLDLTMSTRVNEVTFRVHLTGTVQVPELALSSEPTMSQGDIVSYLLFGESVSGLNSAQMGLVESRAQDVAMAYASQELQATMSRELGVDVMQLKPSDQGQGSALVVGKYISNRALVKYEHSITEGRAVGVTLEYWLIKRFKLETTVQPNLWSGGELSWSFDY